MFENSEEILFLSMYVLFAATYTFFTHELNRQAK